MAGCHHWLDVCEFEWILGDGDGQGGLVCCNPWGRKESDTTKRLNWLIRITIRFQTFVVTTPSKKYILNLDLLYTCAYRTFTISWNNAYFMLYSLICFTPLHFIYKCWSWPTKLVLSPTVVTHSLKNTGQIVCMPFLIIQTILYVTMYDSNVIKR